MFRSSLRLIQSRLPNRNNDLYAFPGGRNRSLYRQGLLFYWMDEGDASCMERNSAIRVGTWGAIFQITLDWSSKVGQLAAYLMMTASQKFDFYEGVSVGVL